MYKIQWIESTRHLQDNKGKRRKVYRTVICETFAQVIEELNYSLTTIYRAIPVKIRYEVTQ